MYKDRGYVVVSAGCIHDVNFLRRLKTIIKLSDAVAFNGYVSGLIYSVFLGKKVFWLPQIQEREYNRMANDMGDEFNDGFNKFLYKIFEDEFDSEKQKEEMMNYYMGKSSFRSKSEMGKILSGDLQ